LVSLLHAWITALNGLSHQVNAIGRTASATQQVSCFGSDEMNRRSEWCEYAPQGRVFLTADQKLRDAALLSGFDAKQM
jgi:hypothetical protein